MPHDRRPPPAPPAEEAALLTRLRAGDRAAFVTLVGAHGGALLRLATGLLKDRAAAEEIVQDTWMAALEHLDRFEGRSALRTWLFSITVNKARNRLEREGRSLPLSALEGEAGPAEDPDRFAPDGHWRAHLEAWTTEDPERLAEAAETRGVVERAIADLPPAMRTVLTLRDLEGLEAEEICNLLSITLSNQRVLLHRARAKVLLALERHLTGAHGC